MHPLLGPLDAIERGAYLRTGERLAPLFRAVSDHLKLVNEEVAGQRDLLAVVLQGTSERDDEAAHDHCHTTFLPLSFITGLFGMNFGWLVRHITSLWVFAAHGIGSLGLSCIVLYLWFRHTGMIGSDNESLKPVVAARLPSA